ncbi:nuclear pore complex protein Nup133 [Epargyreus clarus]|uniref:nuclear pore complex protein Nup133 n=1 Tax=Epargyreus clarus TaxID=520877 RepID=UPI003C2F1385
MDYPSPGATRSPFSPRVRPPITGRRPIGLSSAKKNQNQFTQSAEPQGGDVIYKTPMMTIETFGAPLPVMVTEALTFASGEVTVRMSSCGWCWAVAGRRVLAWSRDAAHPARELALPQTDLAHKADLVVLFYEDGQMPACVGISPEGVIRYWPSVGQEGAYTDVTCELAGQECERLILRPNGGLLLATTTCTLVKIDTCKEGRPTVICQTLRPPSGWLGGIGRRVSLLFFGSMPAHGDTKLVGVVVLGGGASGVGEAGEAGEGGAAAEAGEGECVALLAGGPLLQLWRGAELHEHHLRRPLAEAFARSHLAPQGDLNTLEIMALDMHAHGPHGLLLLVAAVNVARSPEMRYALAHVCVESAERPRVQALAAVRAHEDAPRFLPLGARALLHAPAYLALVAATATSDKAEYIDVSAEGDRIVGAELCDGSPLLFSRKHGVLLLKINEPSTQPPSLCDSPMGSPCPTDMYDGNLSLYEIDPHEVNAISTDLCGKLKTAFLFHVRRSGAAAALLAAAFPPRAPGDVDAPLDRAVRAVAAEMLDDAPAGDPRWKVRGGAALGGSCALSPAAQLRDKQRAFSLFLDFLRAHGLWRRLGLVSAESDECGEGVVSTQSVLGALAEQLAAARALQRAHQSATAIVDAAFQQVALGSEAEGVEEPEVCAALAAGALSAADVCVRRVSRTWRVLRAAARLPPPQPGPRAAAAHALQALTLLNTVVGEMHKCRAQWAQWAACAAPAPAARPLLPALQALHHRALTQCAHNCPDISLRAQVLEAAATLADLMLTEAEPLQHSSHTAHIYERMRREIIQPYIDEGQTERAAVLAEKFKDFDLLIEMCVKKNDMDRLHAYIDKYANEGVAEKAFAWLSSRGGASSALLLRALGGRAAPRLAAWLAAAPARAPLRALHRLAAGDVAPAARLLADMAAEETASVARMTTMASLAKLCLLASDENDVESSDTWQRIERRLALGEQHAALPRDVRARHGLSADDTRVLEPEELVHMYIESESKALNEYDYKKALDLTDFIQDMERRDELRLRIWCACVRRDEWGGSDAPAAALRDKMFFRLMDLVHLMGGDLELLLPPAEDVLTAPELAELASDPRFHFLIKYGYECMDSTHAEHMEV